MPDLVGLTLANARTAWQAAGFTSALHGPANKIVATQSQTPGACLPPDTSITLTFS